MARLNSTLTKPRAMFIDLSGTIHIDDRVIPGSIEALKELKQAKFPHLFVTNTSKVKGEEVYYGRRGIVGLFLVILFGG